MKKTVLILATLLLGAPLGAQGALTAPADSAAGVWTLDRCLAYAMDHNLQLRQKRLAVERNEIEEYAAEGQLFPSLSFSTNQGVSWRPWSNSYVNISNGTMTATQSEVNYNGSYGLSAQWTVWNGGRNRKQLSRARKATEQSAIDTEATALTLQEQIVEAYVRILYQEDALAVNRRILESTEMQRDRAREMVEAGTMSRADLAQLEAQVSQEQYNITAAATQLASSRLSLKQLLQLMEVPDRDFAIAIPNVDEGRITAPVPDVASTYAVAVAQRPEVAAGEIGVELSRMDTDMAKRGYLPTVSMTAGVNTSNTSGMETGFFRQLKTNLSNAAGVTLSVPIFDNRSNSAAVRRAKAAELEAELALESTRTDLYATVEGLTNDVANSRDQYLAASANVDAMRESYALVSEQFAVGLKDIVALTTGKDNLVKAESQLLQAKYTALLSRALLRFYRGEPLNL